MMLTKYLLLSIDNDDISLLLILLYNSSGQMYILVIVYTIIDEDKLLPK